MTTIQSVRDDLNDIRYFFAHRQVFDDPHVSVSEQLREKIDQFNKAISLAPSKLNAVYLELYVHNKTQMELATDWKLSRNYICKLNIRLCEYLVHYFNNCANKVTGKGGKK